MIIQKFILGLIRFYRRRISPLLINSCRFYPSCSQYMYTAVERYGPRYGVWLGIKRILRCHPFSKGGVDQVP